LIDRNLDDPDLTVHLAVQGGNAILLRTADGSVTVYSRLVEGRFPRWGDVFPDPAAAIRIPLDAAAFRHAVEHAAILTSDESRGLDFSFAPQSLTIAGQAADVGSGTVTVPIDHDGPAVGITFDPRYLAEALKAIGDGGTVTAELIDHKNAAVFKTEDGFSYVVMPLTRDR
jgi:DNA polymerase-3 subunit beta